MDIFDLPQEQFEKELDNLFTNISEKDLLKELVDCGLELSPEDRKKWIDPLVVDNQEDAELFINTLERAAAVPHKKVDVDYNEITDLVEIKKIFNSLVDEDTCYETSCLHNSGCDTFEFDGSSPRCLECKKDCPYKIESVDAF